MKHPIQPLEEDRHGTMRFKENLIVRHMLDYMNGQGRGLNDLARVPCSADDRMQFAQLIGYSLSGFSELSYVDDDTYNAACEMASRKPETQARGDTLQEEIAALRDGLRGPIARLYGKHPDDLMEKAEIEKGGE